MRVSVSLNVLVLGAVIAGCGTATDPLAIESDPRSMVQRAVDDRISGGPARDVAIAAGQRELDDCLADLGLASATAPLGFFGLGPDYVPPNAFATEDAGELGGFYAADQLPAVWYSMYGYDSDGVTALFEPGRLEPSEGAGGDVWREVAAPCIGQAQAVASRGGHSDEVDEAAYEALSRAGRALDGTTELADWRSCVATAGLGEHDFPTDLAGQFAAAVERAVQRFEVHPEAQSEYPPAMPDELIDLVEELRVDESRAADAHRACLLSSGITDRWDQALSAAIDDVVEGM